MMANSLLEMSVGEEGSGCRRKEAMAFAGKRLGKKRSPKKDPPPRPDNATPWNKSLCWRALLAVAAVNAIYTATIVIFEDPRFFLNTLGFDVLVIFCLGHPKQSGFLIFLVAYVLKVAEAVMYFIIFAQNIVLLGLVVCRLIALVLISYLVSSESSTPWKKGTLVVELPTNTFAPVDDGEDKEEEAILCQSHCV